MPRSSDSIEAIIDAAVQRVTSRVIPAIQRAIAEAAAARAPKGRPPARRSPAARRRRSREEITRWVADKRARRVPIFVIEATGLDTKKKIVARFGEDVAFEKGKPLPPALSHASKAHRRAGEASAARLVHAKPPFVRKIAGGSPRPSAPASHEEPARMASASAGPTA